MALHQVDADLGDPESSVDFSHVWKWENGVRNPGRHYQARLCLVFDLTPEALGFVASPRLLREIGELKRRLELQHAARTPVGQDGRSDNAFPHVDHERLSMALRHLWPVDRPLLTGLQRAGRELVRRSDIEAPATIQPDLHELRAAIMTLLTRSQASDTAAQLQTMASELSRSIAWLSDHTKRWPDTYTNYALAEALAREAANGNQLAQVLINKSELYSGRATRPENVEAAVQLAEGAAVVICPDALAGLKGWVLGLRATYAAMAHDELTAFRHLDQADRIAAGAPGEMNLFSDYESAWLDSYRAAAVLRLRPLEAITMFEAVLQRTAPELTWERVSALNHLAEAYAAGSLPDIERVSALLRESVDLAQRTGDERGLTLAVQIRDRRLTRWRSEPAVKRLDDAIRAAQ